MQNQSPAEAAARLKEVTTALEKLQQIDVRRGPMFNQGQGLQQMREELKAQLEGLEDQRENISEQLVNPMVSGANRTGLNKRIEALDARISAVDQQLAEVNSAIARSGGASVRIVPPSRPQPQSFRIPEEAFAVSALFVLCVFLPLSIAFARRIWRRSAAAVAAIPQELMERLARLDQNLDAVALEVERIGESQRFLTRALADQQQQLPAGQPERVELASDKGWQRREP